MRLNLKPHRAVLLGSGLPVFTGGDARAVKTTTLLLEGEHTANFQRYVMARLSEWLPRAERAVIQGASHLMHEDNPAATAEAILQFLSRVDV